jgi:hypothetical protein
MHAQLAQTGSELEAFYIGEIHDMRTIAHRDIQKLNIGGKGGRVNGLVEEGFT